MCSPVTTLQSAGDGAGTAPEHGSASCSHSVLCFQKHFCQATHPESTGSLGWTLQGGEVRNKGWTGHRELIHEVVQLVSHRANGARVSTKPMGWFCIHPNTPSW